MGDRSSCLLNIIDKVQKMYFEPKGFESTLFYERIGVRIFKKFEIEHRIFSPHFNDIKTAA